MIVRKHIGPISMRCFMKVVPLASSSLAEVGPSQPITNPDHYREEGT